MLDCRPDQMVSLPSDLSLVKRRPGLEVLREPQTLFLLTVNLPAAYPSIVSSTGNLL